MADIRLCPKFEKAFELLGKRWNGLIIKTLLEGPKRFSEISSIIPQLSDRVLTERFKELEENGIIERTVYTGFPVKVEYKLTQKGDALKAVLDEIEKWAGTWVCIENK
jgi:Predicted transcriptional regulators